MQMSTTKLVDFYTEISMEDHSKHVSCIMAFLLLITHCAALDTISTNQAIKDGKTIVSRGGTYELGFFSPGNSNNRYVGIWYKKISKRTVVWVANRETPITDTSSIFRVSVEGNLLIISGGNILIWTSNSTVSRSDNNPVAQLLDTGNLVVWDKYGTNYQNLIWQSFDYLGDTLLPGMKFGKDFQTGRETFMSSWKSPDDPSPGMYNNVIDTNGYPQVFFRNGSALLSRLGPWTGLGYSGFAIEIPNPIYIVEFVVNKKEIYHKYELITSVVQRTVLTWEGKTLILNWVERIQDWVVYADTGVDSCGRFGFCGSYGSCNINKYPPCSCLDGFEPKLPEEWKASDWSGGCRHKTPLDCGSGDGFWKFSRVKLPDTRRSWYNMSMSLEDCEKSCRRNCSCTAYANLDIRNGGSGCLLWFDELVDIREYDGDQPIYIRMASPDLEVKGFLQSSINKSEVLTMVLSISSAVLFLFAIARACGKKKKNLHVKQQGEQEDTDKRNTSVQMEHIDNVPFLNLYDVAMATNNFSVSNKIGEGGFGTVYKGVLEDGQEVAVKRLSETSRDGLDEFKNELMSAAKLQHRNLVKLIGYCIQENEMILIYEYMANRSLDSILFDETRSSMLDWPRRFHIIQGMARGILYLHQDSRFQIIHRDLKAGNILLDSNMNPKISDFGLARKFVGLDTTSMTKKVVGTYGYISPEYVVHGHFSTKSDVFSFGVMVLEIVSGKKNRGFSHDHHGDNLLGHAWRLYKEDKSIEMVSTSLRAACNISEVLRCIHVALLCVQHHAEDRPTMLSVVLMLVSDSTLPPPKQPAFFT